MVNLFKCRNVTCEMLNMLPMLIIIANVEVVTNAVHILGDKSAAEDDEDVEDPVLVERAIRYFVGNIFSFFVCMLAGLLGLMFLPGAVRVLSITNKSDNPLRVRKNNF